MEDLIPIVIFIILSIIFGGKKRKKQERSTTTHFDSNGNVINPSKSKKSSYSSNVNSLKDVLKSFKDLQSNNFEKIKVANNSKNNKFTKQKVEKSVNYDKKYSNYEQLQRKRVIDDSNAEKKRSHRIHPMAPKNNNIIVEKTVKPKSVLCDLKKNLSKRDEIKKAIILKEIIGKCKAFQN